MAINFLVSLLKKNWNNVASAKQMLERSVGEALAHQEHDGEALHDLRLRASKDLPWMENRPAIHSFLASQ